MLEVDTKALEAITDIKNWFLNSDGDTADIWEWDMQKNPPPFKEAAVELARLKKMYELAIGVNGNLRSSNARLKKALQEIQSSAQQATRHQRAMRGWNEK
jgi:hypothetical protein